MDEEKIDTCEASEPTSDKGSGNGESNLPVAENFLSLVSSPKLYRRAFSCLLAFLPKCVVPAFLLTTSLIVLLIGNVTMYSELARGVMTVHELLKSIVICLVSTVVGLIMFLMGFGKWLVVLTAFCRFWLTSASPQGEGSLSRDDLKKEFNQAIEGLKERSGFLTFFWLRLLVSMLAPVILLYLLGVIKMISAPRLMGGPVINLPQPVDILLMAALVLIALWLSMVSFVSMPVAATSNLEPKLAIKHVFSVARGKFWQALLLTVTVIAVNMLLGSPLLLLRWCNLCAALAPSDGMALYIGQEIWQGVVSIFLWPLSLVPFCELIRHSRHEST